MRSQSAFSFLLNTDKQTQHATAGTLQSIICVTPGSFYGFSELHAPDTKADLCLSAASPYCKVLNQQGSTHLDTHCWKLSNHF